MKQKLVGNDSEMSNSDFDMRSLRKIRVFYRHLISMLIKR